MEDDSSAPNKGEQEGRPSTEGEEPPPEQMYPPYVIGVMDEDGYVQGNSILQKKNRIAARCTI